MLCTTESVSCNHLKQATAFIDIDIAVHSVEACGRISVKASRTVDLQISTFYINGILSADVTLILI